MPQFESFYVRRERKTEAQTRRLLSNNPLFGGDDDPADIDTDTETISVREFVLPYLRHDKYLNSEPKKLAQVDYETSVNCMCAVVRHATGYFVQLAETCAKEAYSRWPYNIEVINLPSKRLSNSERQEKLRRTIRSSIKAEQVSRVGVSLEREKWEEAGIDWLVWWSARIIAGDSTMFFFEEL